MPGHTINLSLFRPLTVSLMPFFVIYDENISDCYTVRKRRSVHCPDHNSITTLQLTSLLLGYLLCWAAWTVQVKHEAHVG